MGLFSTGRQPVEQRHVFENKSNAAVQVWVALLPNGYVMHPGDEMTITGFSQAGSGLNTLLYDDGIHIIAAWDREPEVLINGKPPFA